MKFFDRNCVISIGEVLAHCQGHVNVPQTFCFLQDGEECPIQFIWVLEFVSGNRIQGFMKKQMEEDTFSPVYLHEFARLSFLPGVG